MSMDDQFVELHRFRQHLVSVNERFRCSARELTIAHERADPLWQDSMRRTYDAEYDLFSERVRQYLEREAPNYERFLEEKTAALQRYLYGD